MTREPQVEPAALSTKLAVGGLQNLILQPGIKGNYLANDFRIVALQIDRLTTFNANDGLGLRNAQYRPETKIWQTRDLRLRKPPTTRSAVESPRRHPLVSKLS
jgi:hypothetical protein